MNAAIIMQKCPNEETLAAFVDGRLNEQARLQVTEHLVDCGDCRDIVMTASDYGVAEGTQRVAAGHGGRSDGGRRARPLRDACPRAARCRGRGRRADVWHPIDSRAAARKERNGGVGRGGGFSAGADNGRSAQRQFLLQGNQAHAGRRTEDQPNGEYLVVLAAARIAERAEKNPSAQNLHELGVANILAKQENAENKDAAVQALERAASTDPASGDVLTDLAAAYLARGHDGDAQRAYDAATKAWTMKQTPAAAWNRALALETLERNQEAIDAWRKYLELDPASEWSKEAAKNIERSAGTLIAPHLPTQLRHLTCYKRSTMLCA